MNTKLESKESCTIVSTCETPAPTVVGSLSAHYDRQLQNAILPIPLPEPTTMKEFRVTNPRPSLFDLIHKWNLTEDQKHLLDFYSLKKVAAQELATILDTNKGRYSTVTLCNTYVPIYVYTSRRQIKEDASMMKTRNHPYFLSLRSTGDTHIVLIQRARHDW